MTSKESQSAFVLDERLSQDCHLLADLPFCRLLLMNNALLPWLILVPNSDKTELHELTEAQQLALMKEINLVSRFAQQHFTPDKLNVAAIGNIVRQMHIHIVARKTDDICWPGVVWGVKQKTAYGQVQLERIAESLKTFLPPDTHFHPLKRKA
ncbi:MAG: HIT family protein [Candidatus Thiodiazotropha sp. (ex Monitilora ramsayi)]|nr:HIT family protein [Candidatus Thiodiazotropha sp. (ex Monitilora ramsayi)]